MVKQVQEAVNERALQEGDREAVSDGDERIDISIVDIYLGDKQ